MSQPPPPPPSGPPPAGPPSGVPRQAAQAEEGRDRPWLIPVVIAVIAAVLVAIVFITGRGDDDDDGPPAAAAGEIFLEEIAAVGRDPFTASVAASAPTSTVAPNTPVTVGGPGVAGGPTPTAPLFGRGNVSRDISGGTPGLYGGTGSQVSCNQQQMIDFLDDNPSKRAAWAQVQGIRASEVTAYIQGLTPVLLRGDTRVTNHGFRNGRATPKQSVLQAGTAVLVDEYGVPRARCACGNPLTLAQPVPVPRYTGTEWPGFLPTNLAFIQQNTTTINVFTVVNVTNGETYGIPKGQADTTPAGTTTTSLAAVSTTVTTGGGSAALNPVVGYWTGDWGEMVLRAGSSPLEVIGVYAHDDGTVKGTYDPATKTFTGWWCEAPSRAPTSDAGDVEFRFSGSTSQGLSDTLDGKWRYASSGAFSDDWDLRRSASEPPPALTARFSQTSTFCSKS